MKKLFIGFLILLFAIWIGLLMQRDPGYILISYGSWSIEMSLWIGIIISILGFSILHMLLRLILHTTKLGTKFQDWGKERNKRKSATLTTQGLCQLVQADWEKAEDTLKKAIKGSATPLVNYLSAARAAHYQKAYDRRDNYLRHANKTMERVEDTIDLTKVRFHLDTKEYPHALQLLKSLNERIPNHPLVLKLLHLALLGNEDWKQLVELLPRFRKHKVLPESDLHALEEKVFIALLTEANTPESLKNIWEEIPKGLKTNPQVTTTVVQQAIHQQCEPLAINAIENALKKQWNTHLVKYYGLIQNKSDAKQLEIAESWLKKHPEDPELLLCLGRLSQREKLWGKAKHYLETAIQIKPSTEIHNTLAHVHESLDEPEAALQNYRKGAQIN